ncbi:MAG: TonB-dependent receptor [Gammaproteobacteria bacterium]|nr:TonB-dependent receptor [Gammaproteobacteria bacterium]
MRASTSSVQKVALVCACAILQAPDTSTAQETDDDTVEEIVVTGSRIKRRDLTAPSPITTLGEAELQAAPQPTLEESLNQVPQLIPDMSRVVNNGSNGQARLNLRGLGAQRTLILLNGRRQAPSGTDSAVDLNNIPQALIDRVEIITGGASTVYGSDALAGVVNFITRDDFEGLSIEAGYGVSEEGDGSYQDLNIAWGTDFSGGRGNVVLYGGYFERDDVFGRDRDLTTYVWTDPWDGTPITQGGSFGIPETGVFFPEFDWDIGQEDGYTTFNADGTPRGFVWPDDLYNYQEVNYIQTPHTRYNVGLMGTLAVGDSFELYVESAFANNQSSQELAPAVLFEFVAVNYDNPVLAPETRQFFIDNVPPIAPGIAGMFIGHRLLGAGPRHIDQDRDYFRTVLGMRGELGGGWAIDGWVTYTKSDEQESLLNTGSLQRFMQGLLVDPVSGQCFDPSNGCVPVDIFGPGRVSEEAGNFLRYQPLTNITSREQQLASVYITGSPFDTWAGPLDIATGLDWRSDDVSFSADDALFTGDAIGYNGDAPVEGKESVTEAYLETIIPLLSGVTGAEYLGIEAGARYSKYDNAGGIWTYKAGASWEVTSSLRFRAMSQKSVRAPNNLELFQEQFVVQGGYAFDPTDDLCSASQDPIGNGNTEKCVIQGLPADQVGVFEADLFYPTDYLNGGNTELVPEEATTVTIGATLTPEFMPSWSFSVDYYEMEVEREIGDVDPSDICFNSVNTANVFCDKIRRDATGNVFEVDERIENRGFLSTSGVDTQINYVTDLPDGLALFSNAQFNMQVIWTHVLESEEQANPTASVIPCVGTFGSTCIPGAGVLAEDRVAASFDYRSDALGVMLMARWIAGTENFALRSHLYFNEPEWDPWIAEVGSQFYLNLNINYEFTDSIAASFGVANLLDQDAPMMADNTFGPNTDSGIFDVFGRAYSLTIRVALGN